MDFLHSSHWLKLQKGTLAWYFAYSAIPSCLHFKHGSEAWLRWPGYIDYLQLLGNFGYSGNFSIVQEDIKVELGYFKCSGYFNHQNEYFKECFINIHDRYSTEYFDNMCTRLSRY